MSAGVYIDTGILIKSYVLEIDSPLAIEIIETTQEPLPFSHLHAIEIPNAIRLKHFRGEISKSEEAAAIHAFYSDIKEKRLVPCRYDLIEAFHTAEKLSAKFSAEFGTRSLDLLHIAVALEMKCTTFVSWDHRQHKVASLSGMKVIPDKRRVPI